MGTSLTSTLSSMKHYCWIVPMIAKLMMLSKQMCVKYVKFIAQGIWLRTRRTG